LVKGEALNASELQALKETFLAESIYSSDEAQARGTLLRHNFARALDEALRRTRADVRISTPAASGNGSSSTSAPRVSVEVRQNARTIMQEAVFTVGRAMECDIQVSGDFTVSKLHLVVVSSPEGILVIDAWSSGGTRVVQQSSSKTTFPASKPPNRTAFMLDHGDASVLMIGKKTTVTLATASGSAAGAATCAAAAARVAEHTVEPGDDGEHSTDNEEDSDAEQLVAQAKVKAKAKGRGKASAKGKAKSKAKAKAKVKAGVAGQPKAKAKGKAKAEGETIPAKRHRPDEDDVTPEPLRARASSSGAACRGRATQGNPMGHLYRGGIVEFHGLQDATQLNGRTGILRQFMEETGRWQVEIEGVGLRRILPAKLRLIE